MFSKDRWIEILEVLSSNMLRTIATAFGVGWGIFILIILLAAGKGLENGIRADFGDIATNTMFMWSQATSKPYKGLPPGSGLISDAHRWHPLACRYHYPQHSP